MNAEYLSVRTLRPNFNSAILRTGELIQNRSALEINRSRPGGHLSNTLVLATLQKTAILGLLLLLPAIAKAQIADSNGITDLLKEAKSHAVLAEDDALTLESYTR